jgi:electron transfer flavoprotein beta subunit
VGPQLAELLNIAHASFVKQVAFEQKRSLIVTRALERGYMKLRVKLPALLSVVKEINQPRLPTIWGILEAKNKEITVWGAADVGAIAENIGLSGSPTQVIGVCKSEIRRENEIFEGPPEEIVKKALARLSKLQAI